MCVLGGEEDAAQLDQGRRGYVELKVGHHRLLPYCSTCRVNSLVLFYLLSPGHTNTDDL